MREDINRIPDPVFLSQADQTVCHVKIVRAGGILGTDGYPVFISAQIISQRAHINRQKLFNILRDITAPVSDLLIIADGYLEGLFRLAACLMEILKQPQDYGRGCLVIQMLDLIKPLSV